MKQYAIVLVAVAMFAAVRSAHGQALTQEEALRLAFPAPTQIERRTAYLDDAQLAKAQQLAGGNIEITQRVVSYYVGLRNGAPTGVAYFDAHRVRTLTEVVMIVAGPGDVVQRVEILKFLEPPEYHASKAWLGQFNGKQLTPALSLKRGIANMTGATITSNAVTNAVRRVLALNAIIAPFGSEK